MNDMSMVIVPKSDQINSDDLLAGPITITVASVSIRPGTEQPVSIHFEGDGGKPYKPCKSMCRVMVQLWGADANNYVGRSMTLFCDPAVQWGGMKVGGIRISHMSHIEGSATMALTATKGSRKPFTVKPLVVEKPKPQATQDKQREGVDRMLGRIKEATSVAALDAIVRDQAVIDWRGKLMARRPELEQEIVKAVSEAYNALMPPPSDDDDDFPGVVTPREVAET